jgi:hypothetical protein
MNRLSILLLLLLSFLSVSSVNATLVESSDVSVGAISASNIALDVNSDANNETTFSSIPNASQIIPQTDSVPPTSWVIGLGLCLIFLGYKMKNKAH